MQKKGKVVSTWIAVICIGSVFGFGLVLFFLWLKINPGYVKPVLTLAGLLVAITLASIPLYKPAGNTAGKHMPVRKDRSVTGR